MHVLLVSHYTLPHIGGIEVLVDQLGACLQEGGHTVTVVSSRAGGPREETRGRLRIKRVPAWNVLERLLHVPYPLFAPALISTLARAVREADVVHVHGILYLSSLCALWWAWWLEKPLVLTEHVGFVPYRNRLLSALQRLALAAAAWLFLRRADAVITYNSVVQDWIKRHTPNPERLHFIRNGIDLDSFHPAATEERAAARLRLGLDSKRPLALFVGRFVEKKGVDTLLDAADGSFDLLLCGRGELPAERMKPAVRVLRDVPREQMPTVYRAADVFVLPSCGEGFPVATMEAMASGLPVIAVHDPAYAAYVTDLEMRQTAADAASIRAAVVELMASAEERARRGHAARARAVADFGLDVSVARHLAVYEQASAHSRLSRALSPLGHDLATRLKLPVLRALLGDTPPRPWIEVGPGSGYATHHVFGRGSIVIVDVSAANLIALRARARAAGDPDRFLPLRADLAALPFRDGAAGTVLCTEVLEHVADDHGAAAELMRVLSPGGRLIVEVPHVARGYASYLELLGVTTVHDVLGPEYHHRPGYTVGTLESLFAARGGKLTARRTFAGFVALLLMDSVALVHLIYERRRLGRSAWTWADVEQVTRSPLFRLYRWLFPLLLACSRLDIVFSRGVGFILGARVEKVDNRR
jgi:D-inositol-3-phosphate glycosyltransferase